MCCISVCREVDSASCVNSSGNQVEHDVLGEKNHEECCAGKLCLTNSAEFSKGVYKHVDVAHFVDKAGTDLQQGFTISLTKGS